jgi:hypothetical protein
MLEVAPAREPHQPSLSPALHLTVRRDHRGARRVPLLWRLRRPRRNPTPPSVAARPAEHANQGSLAFPVHPGETSSHKDRTADSQVVPV